MRFFGKKARGACEYIIAGLGNPGDKYARTRHNAGFLAIDYIAEKAGVKINRLKHMALTARADIDGKSVLLMKPQTYMNNSGESITDAAKFFKIPPERIIVLCDDTALDTGKLRIRRSGSSGGQKGLESVIERMGEGFPRIRIGVGAKPHPDYDLADYVLSSFTKKDMELITAGFDKVFEAAGLIMDGNIEKAMNLCN